MREHQLSYTLLCKTSALPWTLTIYLPSGTYRTVKDVIHGMLRGLHNGLRDIYLKSEKTVTSLGGSQCFYINEKAQDFFELKLPPGWFVTLPKTLAHALSYLNQTGTLVQQNDDQSVLLVSTTTTLARNARKE